MKQFIHLTSNVILTAASFPFNIPCDVHFMCKMCYKCNKSLSDSLSVAVWSVSWKQEEVSGCFSGPRKKDVIPFHVISFTHRLGFWQLDLNTHLIFILKRSLRVTLFSKYIESIRQKINNQPRL